MVDIAVELCAIPECTKPRHAKGWCCAHYTRWSRHGDPLAPLVRTSNKGLSCSVDGCEQPRRKRTWCAAHYAQWKRYGTEPRPFIYKWAKERRCVVCGKTDFEGNRRKYCSLRCNQRAVRGEIAASTTCTMCGDAISLRLDTSRKRRCDVRLCFVCSRRRYTRHGFSAKVLARRDGPTCHICGELVDFSLRNPHPLSASVDHLIPRAHGGTDDPLNLRLAHLTCNQNKHARLTWSPLRSGSEEVSGWR